MNDDAFRKLIDKRIIECRWEDICERWLEYVSEIDPPGSAPPEGVSDFLPFRKVAADLSAESGTPRREQVNGLREYAFREAVYLLHKAIHVSGVAETSVQRGYKTWPLADAYQAALFGAKSILGFCGIVLAEYEKKGVLIDLFPKEQDTQKRRQKLKLKLLSDPEVELTKLSIRFEHRHVWMIFSRMIRVFRLTVWPDEYVTAFARIQASDYAKQRNDLNYKNEYWTFDDLFSFDFDAAFGKYTNGLDNRLQYDPVSDFSVTLCLSVIRLCRLMLDDICSVTNLLDPELELIAKNMTSRNPLFALAFPG
jgi:hypothetical protein